jgi:hypothetical protein
VSNRRTSKVTDRPRAKKLLEKFASSAEQFGMAESNHRSRKCGMVYSGTESMVPSRQTSSFECALRGWSLEYNLVFRLVARPVRFSELDRGFSFADE